MYIVTRKLFDNFLVAKQMSLRKEKEENKKTFCEFFNK